MHEGFLQAPGLFILSKSDLVSTPAMSASVYEKWEKNGASVSLTSIKTGFFIVLS